MKRPTVILLLGAALGILSGASPAAANPLQAFENAWESCAQQTSIAERRMGVPRHLLTAISLAESGRWDDSSRANVAWPWTVTTGGEGRFFDTRAEAIAEVEILMTQGVSNIDVGCMQVNLFYHGGAFETLDEAFDPRANATYAAAYLKNMHALTGDWADAAGYYHSMTPERSGPYREKVVRFWRQRGGDAVAGLEPGEPGAKRAAPIDHARMARLNDAFRARREAKRAEAPDPASRDALQTVRRRQLAQWRDAMSRGVGIQHLIAMRQAELERRKKRELDRLGKGDEKARFTERRRRQLRDWRMKIAGTGSLTGPIPLAATRP
ncbi:MAG: murein transglycosylase [Rhodospirillales bacterium]